MIDGNTEEIHGIASSFSAMQRQIQDILIAVRRLHSRSLVQAMEEVAGLGPYYVTGPWSRQLKRWLGRGPVTNFVAKVKRYVC